MIVRQALAGFFSQVSNFSKFFAVLVAAAVLVVGVAGQASANPRYAAYVIDARTGQVLFSRNADARRYPASLTKMMTIYLVLEAIESGRINKNSRIPISAKAAAEPPTKIGLKAGSTITVENAILTMVTRSANDISTAVGEFIGGSEASFARMMTAKARQLGMNSTQFRNAHGLPNPEQYTTARDMAILGIALREHFPQHYSYFSTRSFTLGKQRIGNHNRMLGRIEGVDGIKTGYIRASGFNLVSSVRNNGRSIVAVVMGGQSAASRDDHMAALIREHLPRASRGGGGSNLVASRQPTPGTQAVASAGTTALPTRNIPMPAFRPTAEPQVAQAQVPAEVDMQVTAYVQQTNPVRASAPMPSAPVPSAPVPTPTAAVADDRFASGEGSNVDPVMTASTAAASSGWVVQIASSPSQSDAFAALVRTGKEASGVLGSANAFIEEFNNKGTTYYRARFGGFASKDQAWNACNALKRQKIDCYAVGS
jgi:D-alanyl-D-alanine carboxypeptidase